MIVNNGLTEGKGGVLDYSKYFSYPILQQSGSTPEQAFGVQGSFPHNTNHHTTPTRILPVRHFSVAAVGLTILPTMYSHSYPDSRLYSSSLRLSTEERHAEDTLHHTYSSESRHGDSLFDSYGNTTGLGSILAIPVFPSPVPSNYNYNCFSQLSNDEITEVRGKRVLRFIPS